MTREETIAELKRARSKWAYVLYDDLTKAIGDAIEILEKSADADRAVGMREGMTIDKETGRACQGYKTAEERDAYCDGYFDGHADAVKEVFEIIDKVSHKASARGQFWTAEKAIKVLQRDVLALKGEQG